MWFLFGLLRIFMRQTLTRGHSLIYETVIFFSLKYGTDDFQSVLDSYIELLETDCNESYVTCLLCHQKQQTPAALFLTKICLGHPLWTVFSNVFSDRENEKMGLMSNSKNGLWFCIWFNIQSIIGGTQNIFMSSKCNMYLILPFLV